MHGRVLRRSAARDERAVGRSSGVPHADAPWTGLRPVGRGLCLAAGLASLDPEVARHVDAHEVRAMVGVFRGAKILSPPSCFKWQVSGENPSVMTELNCGMAWNVKLTKSGKKKDSTKIEALSLNDL